MCTITPLSDRLECPKCGAHMMLAGIVPEGEGKDVRTFECLVCEHSESVVVKFRSAASS
jgi:transcription elongation factor Elf1